MPGAIDQMNAKGGGSTEPAQSGGGALAGLSGDKGAPKPSSSSKSGGFFKSVLGGLGSVAHAVRTAPSLLGTLAVELPKELLPGNLSQGGINPLGRTHDNPGGFAGVKKNMPITAGALTSLAKTTRQIPDTAIGTFEPGVGFGKTDLGQQIKHEGVVNTGLAKAGDLSILFGGAGLIGKAAGAGRLAEIARLGDVAEAGIKAAQTGEKIETAADAARLAEKAAAAGDVTKATNMDSIAKTLAQKESLLAQGPATLAERATAAATNASHFGAHVAGGPAEVYVKGAQILGKGVKAIPGVEEFLANAGEAVRNSKLAQARAASKVVSDAAHEHITGEQARLNSDILKGGRAAIKAGGGDATTEAAAILRHTGAADTLSHLADLPDEQLAPLLAEHVGPGFTPEALRLAVSPTPAVEAAQQAFGDTVAAHENRFVTQYGNKAQLSDAALANRAAGVTNPLEPLPIALDKETERLQSAPKARLAATEAESEAIRQRNLDAREGKMSPGAERQVAADKATARSIDRQVKREEQRAASVAKATDRAKAGVEDRAANRTGRIIGEGSDKLEEARQLNEGDAASKPQNTRRKISTAKAAATADTRLTDLQQKVFGGGNVAIDRLEKTAERAGKTQLAADEAASKVSEARKPTTEAQVRRSISGKAKTAETVRGAEARTTEKLTGAETRRQEGALAKAQRESEAAKIRTSDRADRLQNEANRRLVRNDETRLATLHERADNYRGKIADAATKAAESTKVAPAPARGLLLQAKGIAKDLHDAGLHAEADALPKTLADLKAAGVEPKYAPGGTEEAKPGGSKKTTSAEVTRKKLMAETERKTGTLPSSFKASAEKMLNESRGMARNEFGPRIAKIVAAHTGGVERVADLFKDYPELKGLKGEELASALKDAGYRAWEPAGTGRTVSAAKLDGIHESTPVIPEAYAGKVDQLLKVQEGEPETYAQMVKRGVLKGFDRATAGGRVAKLLEPGWQVKKTLGDPAMLAAMGVNPLQAAVHFPDALEAVRHGDLTPGLGASAEGRLAMEQPTTRLGKAARATTDKLFTPFQKADALAREIGYRAKLSEGLSPQAAAAAVRRGLGDLQDMTGAEKNVLKRTFTFYPWQKHVAQTLLRIPLEHPAGMAQAAHLVNIENKAHPEDSAGLKFQLEKATNPLESSVLSMIGENPSRGVSAAGSQINPTVRALLTGATGADPSRGLGQVTDPNRAFGAAPKPLAAEPIEYLKYLAQLAPPTRTLQDLLNTDPAKGGKLPQRYSTGEPVRAGTKHKGAVKPATLGATTKKQALLKAVGIEPPEAPKLSKAKKK